MLVGLMCCLLVLSGLSLAVPLARAATPSNAPAASGTLTIVVPAPSNGVAVGPVGANVSVTASGLTASDSYQVGYAPHSIGCASGFSALPNTSALSPASDGSLSTTVTWPSSANAVGSSYDLCLRDTTTTTNLDVASTQTFRVESSAPPSITVAEAGPASSTATTTTTSATTVEAGTQVTITGQNYVPDNTPLAAYITYSSTPTASELSQGKLKQCPAFNSQGGGYFTVTCILPSSNTGPWYLIVASTDGAAKYPPALEAMAALNIVPAPAATATTTPAATASASPKASTTPHGNTGGTGNGGKASPGPTGNEVAGIIGLSALAIILFVVGVLLLASTLTTPRRPGA